MIISFDFSYSAVGYNFLLAAFVIEWALIVRGYIFDFNLQTHKFTIDVERMIAADFVAAAVLISFGAVIGKTNPTQLIIMSFIEVLLQSSNQFLGFHRFCAYDVGQSMFVHAFGMVKRQTFSLIYLSFNRCFLWNWCSIYAL
jgi:ammonium transporter Rh